MFLQHLQEAAHLNVAGASMMANNNRGGAVRAFKTAIQIMEALSVNPEADGKIRSNQEQACSAMEMPAHSQFHQTKGVCDEVFFVFNQPLLFHVTPEALDLGFYNGVIMFNLALAFHQEASRMGDHSKFTKAVNLYNLCANLLAGDTTAASNAVILAAVNNSTQAYLKLGAYDHFRDGIQRLSEQAACLAAHQEVASDTTSTTPLPFEQNHFEEFYLNITLAHEPTTAAVA